MININFYILSKIELSIDFNKDVFLLHGLYYLSVFIYWTPKANNQILLSCVVYNFWEREKHTSTMRVCAV